MKVSMHLLLNLYHVSIVLFSNLMELRWDVLLQVCHCYCYQRFVKSHMAITEIFSYVKAKCIWVHYNFSIFQWLRESTLHLQDRNSSPLHQILKDISTKFQQTSNIPQQKSGVRLTLFLCMCDLANICLYQKLKPHYLSNRGRICSVMSYGLCKVIEKNSLIVQYGRGIGAVLMAVLEMPVNGAKSQQLTA